MEQVKFENVSLAYDEDGPLAIRDISLSVAKNEFIAVVGPSGCGKSTLMKLVSGLTGPTDGYVFVAGKQVNGPQKCIGMAFQASNLLPWRTTLDNVMLPLEIVQPYRRQMRHKKKDFEERCRALLARVGLAGNEDKFPWELSGGMQQRASICRALIHKPELLMLDEPFGALDAFTKEELWLMLQELWQEEPFTVILVTHDLREAAFLADTVYVLSNGPGELVAQKAITQPRPRSLEWTYTDDFAKNVYELRDHIGRVRNA